jgi:uncharacterized RDD family membrane protein YckC
MNTEPNPYSPPQADVADPSPSDGRLELASRWVRLGGAIADGIAVSVITVPTMYLSGYWSDFMSGKQPDLSTQIGWSAFGFLAFIAIHGYFLHRDGQTLAKRLLDIKIVDMQGRKPPFWRLVVLRYLVLQLIYLVPVAGGLVATIGILFIFREDRRPLHDHLAGTQVVVAR